MTKALNFFFPSKIISGGQTGADRGGLDAAIEAGIPHGGWCPKGRKAEDGGIPEKYQLQEMKSADYLKRTEQNIIDSDCTVIFTYGPPTGGSKRTVGFCEKHKKPCLCIDLSHSDDHSAFSHLHNFLSNKRGGIICPGVEYLQVPPAPVLNVAGSRESKSPGIQGRVAKIVKMLLEGKHYAMREE